MNTLQLFSDKDKNMITVRWIDGNRTKQIEDSRLAEYLSYGWIVCDDNAKQEPVEMPVPVVLTEQEPYVDNTEYGKIVAVNPEPEKEIGSNVDRLEAAMKKHKRGRGRPKK